MVTSIYQFNTLSIISYVNKLCSPSVFYLLSPTFSMVKKIDPVEKIEPRESIWVQRMKRELLLLQVL